MKIYRSEVTMFLLLIGFYTTTFHVTAAPQKTTGGHTINNFSMPHADDYNLPDTNTLKKALIDFMAKADSGNFQGIVSYYDSNFVSVRVVDAGPFIKMNYNQMISFWKMITAKPAGGNNVNHKAITTQSTTIHYMEILGDTAYVLLTRVKDLGNGPEPMFYNLIWIYRNERWYLFREIVHQRTMPSFH